MANVGYATLQIIPSARGFGAALQGQTSAPMAAAGKSGGKKFGGALLGSLKGFAGPLAAIFGVKAIGGFMKSAVSEASNLNESVNAVNVAYGKNAKAVLAVGRNSADAFGLSKNGLNEFAVRFSAFAKTIAGSKGNVAGTFKTIMGRATDFASVFNIDVEEAASLFQSGLAGETEPLRRFGIDLSAATVQAYAYSHGIAKAGSKLTQSQKVQAAYGSLMKQTAKVQGDFSNTSNQLANRQRIMAARWTNLKATLGSAFLPILNKVLGVLNGALGPALKYVTKFVDGFGKSSGKASGILASLQKTTAPLMATLRQIGQNIMAVVKPAFAQISSIFQGQLVPAFKAFLPAAMPVANFLLKIIGGAVVGVLKGVVNVVKGVLTVLSGIFNVFAGLFTGNWSRLWKGLKQIVSGVFTALIGAFQVWWNVGILSIFKRGAAFLLKGVWKKLFTGLKGLAAKGMEAAKGVLSAAWNAIKGLFSRALSGIIRGVRAYFNLYKTIIRTAFTFARNFIAGAWSAIRSIIVNTVGRVVGAVRGGFGRLVSSVRSAIGKAVSFVRSLPGKALSALGGIGSKLFSAGKNLIQGFVNGVKSMASGLISAVTEPIKGAIGKAKSLLGIHSPSRVFMEIGGYTAQGMAIGIQKGAGKVSKATASMISIPNVSSRAGGAGGGSVGRALIENLTLQGSGNVHDDLEEVFFQVRRLERGGAYA